MSDAAFQATLAGTKHLKSRGVFQFILEVPEEQADSCLAKIGGIPLSSESRWVAVARLTEINP